MIQKHSPIRKRTDSTRKNKNQRPIKEGTVCASKKKLARLILRRIKTVLRIICNERSIMEGTDCAAYNM